MATSFAKTSILGSILVLSFSASIAGCSADDGGTTVSGTGGSGTGGAATASGGLASSSGGTGGTSLGSGGLASGGSTSSGGTTPSEVKCTGSEIFCEDFEDDTADAWPLSPWSAEDSSCPYQMGFDLGVTGSTSHLGSKALKLTNTSYPQCRAAVNLGSHDELWIRYFVKWDAGINFSKREVIEADLTTSGGLGKDDPAIRFGYRSKAPCEASAGPQITIIGLAGGEATGCSTTKAIPEAEWYCFEAHVQQASKIVVSTFINGTALEYTSSGKPVTSSIESASPTTEKLTHLRLGMFGTTGTTGNVYIDDVAVSATRLGCGAAP